MRGGECDGGQTLGFLDRFSVDFFARDHTLSFGVFFHTVLKIHTLSEKIMKVIRSEPL